MRLISQIITSLYTQLNPRTQTYDIYLPYIPLTLQDLLQDPHFTPIHYNPSAPLNTAHPPHDRVPSSSPDKQSRWTETINKIITQSLDALTYLHVELGFAHRDLKPGNVLVDFGHGRGWGLGASSGSGWGLTGVEGLSSGAEVGGRTTHDEQQDRKTPCENEAPRAGPHGDDERDIQVQIKLIDFGTALDMSLPDPRPVHTSGIPGEDQEEEEGYRGRRVLQVGSG